MPMGAFVSAWMIRHTCVQKHPRELKEPGSKLFCSRQMRPELDPCQYMIFPRHQCTLRHLRLGLSAKRQKWLKKRLHWSPKRITVLWLLNPKAYVPTHASTWASNSMRLRWERPGIHEPEELHRYRKYSEELRGLCARVHDCTLYYMDSTTEIDILSVTGADKCPYRKYEQLHMHSLEYQLTSARERWQENQDIEGSEREIGDNIVNVANCLLDCISKAETDMKHVTGEQLQRVLNPVLDQCDQVLRRIACLRLPPVYPRLLELTDAGPGVGVSSAESRIRILEKARMHGNEKVLRIHRAREDSGQNEAERLNACIGDALCDGGSLKWQIYETLHGLSEEEVKSLSTSELDAHSSKIMEKNAWAVAEEVCLRIDDSPEPRRYVSAFLVDRPENHFFYNREYLK